MKKKISVMSPCFNEEGNIEELYARVKNVFEVTLAGKYDWEILFIDNASKDQTPKILKSLAQKDSKIKVILNTRNFGHIRSPHYALLQTDGDATICMASDLQDPPEVIPGFIKEWEQGFKVIVGTKDKSLESPGMFAVRKFYYWLVGKISSIELIQNFTGFGLYDRTVIETLRKVPDPYPYFRGLIAELGWEVQKIPFVQPRRKRGITANNFYTLYDMAILGITSHSRVPLRIATFLGFLASLGSFLLGSGYLAAKLLFWDKIPFGFAPVLIGVFFLGSLQLFFVGIIGEYIGFIHTQVLKRPLVVEKERINF